MADPRVLFGERRLPEFLGGRRTIELTPELRRALSEVGLPSYRDGGLVSLLPV